MASSPLGFLTRSPQSNFLCPNQSLPLALTSKLYTVVRMKRKRGDDDAGPSLNFSEFFQGVNLKYSSKLLLIYSDPMPSPRPILLSGTCRLLPITPGMICSKYGSRTWDPTLLSESRVNGASHTTSVASPRLLLRQWYIGFSLETTPEDL